MNTLKKTIAIALVAFASASLTSVSVAQGVPPSTTFEVLLKNFQMADAAVGAVGFKECDTCNYERLRLTPRTSYMIDGKALRFEDFRKALLAFRDSGASELNINVKRDDTSGTVASVFIYTS